MAIIFIQGVGYHFQSDYVLLIEMLLYASIELGDDFFLYHGKDNPHQSFVCQIQT